MNTNVMRRAGRALARTQCKVRGPGEHRERSEQFGLGLKQHSTTVRRKRGHLRAGLNPVRSNAIVALKTILEQTHDIIIIDVALKVEKIDALNSYITKTKYSTDEGFKATLSRRRRKTRLQESEKKRKSKRSFCFENPFKAQPCAHPGGSRACRN